MVVEEDAEKDEVEEGMSIQKQHTTLQAQKSAALSITQRRRSRTLS